MKRGYAPGILAVILFLLLFPVDCQAEIAGDQAFNHLTWEMILEDQPMGENGIVQSICATEDYIICIENTSDFSDAPDVISAYYRNPVDENGNPVLQYSLAKRVADTDWEHGNGMAYNPKTHEIYVALYTSKHPEHRGCLFVMDPDTLQFKRQIKISDDYNILGIGYQEEQDRYIIQTNIEGGYSFKILDSDFQIVEDLGEYADTAEGNNFQDLCVSEDYIINFPLTLGLGIGDFLHVYSISERKMVAAPKLDFSFQDVTSDEPEGLCELEPGIYLAVVNVTKSDGSKAVCIYRTEVPYYYDVKVESEYGTASVQEQKVLRGKTLSIDYLPDKGFELAQITIDGIKKKVDPESENYRLTNVRGDHVVQLKFTKIPLNVSLIISSSLMILTVFLAVGAYLWMIHVKRERKRRRARARIARQRLMWQEEMEM